MQNFNYDPVQLIKAVKARPCLWNRHIESYKDKSQRMVAWEEVFSLLDEQYEDMSKEDKKTIRDTIISKWVNLRDTFLKSLKKMNEGKSNRKYVFYDEICFLKSVLKFDEGNTSNETIQIDWDYSMKREDSQSEVLSGAESTEYETYIPKKRKVREEKPEMSFVGVEEVNDPRLMNEDEAFFASLLPTVVRYNEDERLEFRMEVLAVMKKIKDKRVDLN